MFGSIVTKIKRPNKDFLFSPIFTTEQDILEFILSCGDILTAYTVKYEFGICRSDSETWEDYTLITNHERSIIANRNLERTATADNLVFSAENGRWCSGCEVEVYEVINNVNTLLTSDYTLNRIKGNVVFSTSKTNRILITIKYPNIYKLGIRILTYDNVAFPLYKFGIMFSKNKV